MHDLHALLHIYYACTRCALCTKCANMQENKNREETLRKNERNKELKRILKYETLNVIFENHWYYSIFARQIL